MSGEKEILTLTGLRFIAAFYVFLFHIQIRWPITNYRFIKNILEQGAIGMSLFFMLSGFVLAYRYADGNTSIKDYLINRFARIYPIYLVAAIVTLPWIGISFGNGSFNDIAKGVGQGLFLIFANILLIQAWFIQFFSYWNNGGSWSISVEAFCYILLPFLLPSLTRLSIKRLIAFAVMCLLLTIFTGFTVALFNDPNNRVFYSMPIFRFPEFLIGTFLYLVIRNGHVYLRGGGGGQIFIILTFLIYLGFLGPKMPLYVGHNWISIPTIAFMIFSLSNGQGWIATLLANPILVWLGKISYCFYSFQGLVILILISYHDKLIQIIPYFENNIVLAIASFFLLLACSAVGHYLIEEPARLYIRHYHK